MEHDDRPGAPGLIAIGASAGGIEALQRLMRDLPADLPAAVCLVLHIPASARSLLAEIVGRMTVLPVEQARHGTSLRGGHVYVAPPDRHLSVRRGRAELDRGPKENGVRPAIDALFRSVAEQYGPRGIAVVLSGALSDGAGGAAAVARAGGAVLVQDPDDALVPSMPEAALAAVPAARRFGARDLADALARRAAELPQHEPEESAVTDDAPPVPDVPVPDGPPVGLTCPECHGPLWELRDGGHARYRCRVGHVFGQDVLLADKGAAIESALWMALEALDERRELLHKVADRLDGGGKARAASRMRETARVAGERAELIRGVLAIDEDPDAVDAVSR